MIDLQNKKSYDIMLRNIARKGNYSLEIRANQVFIISDHKKIARYHHGAKIKDLEKNKEDARMLFKAVKSSATKFIKKNNITIEVIERKHSSVYYNNNLWNSLPVNTEFYLLDAKHCYWRIAFILGYIGKTLYNKYCNNKEFKTLRNISLALFNSDQKRQYYINGDKLIEIHCDKTPYRTMYENIRTYAYNNSGQIKESLPDACLCYKVDGVMVLKTGLKKASKIFECNKLFYKKTKCIKIDEKSYCNEDGEIKKFS